MNAYNTFIMLYQKNNPSINIGASIMQQGGVIAYPTEAVWGLGCDPYNSSAVGRILTLKQRKPEKGLILVAANINQFTPFLEGLSYAQIKQLEQSWPGPITWLVPNNGALPRWITGHFSSVALRVSAHPYVKYLCEAFGAPIVSTSANPQGKPAPRQRWGVSRYFMHASELDYIVRGRVGNRLAPSQIKHLIGGQVIR